jgi:RNA polymerase sigma factor (sigma-70 family)
MKPIADSKSTQRARVEGAALRLLSDERLARLAAGGDRAAFAVIFDRYQQRLFAYCASILHDRDDAADAVQSTMLRAMRALEGEEREIAVRPWLYRIAHNESIELLRRPRTEPENGAEVVTVSDVEADAAVRAHLRAVLEDIRELPDRQRSALVMRELSGLSYAEIGTALMSSEAGAKQAVYDARQALHELAKGRDSDCEAIRRKLSDGDRRVFRGRVIRAHLTACAACRTWQAELAARETSWAAFSPAMPAAAAAALQGTVGGGAGAAAAGSVASATATAPAVATMAVAVVLGAGAVGVNEMRKGDEPERPPPSAQQAQASPARAPAGRQASRRSSKPREQSAAARRRKRDERKTRAERARAGDGAATARDRRAGRTGKGDGDKQAGAGSTGLGGRGTGGRTGTNTRGGGGDGIKSWVGGGRGRGGGGRENGSGPIRGAVDETRDAVQGTVNQVQEALPVPTPPVQLPGARQPRGAAPRRAH